MKIEGGRKWNKHFMHSLIFVLMLGKMEVQIEQVLYTH